MSGWVWSDWVTFGKAHRTDGKLLTSPHEAFDLCLPTVKTKSTGRLAGFVPNLGFQVRYLRKCRVTGAEKAWLAVNCWSC